MGVTDGPGGGGSNNADSLSLEQMIAIAKADKSHNERTREQAEGAKLAEEVLDDMHRVLSEKTKELKKNFSSPADGALYNSLDKAIPSLKDAATSAGDLNSALESAADTVDRNYDKMAAYEKEQGQLETTDPKDLKSFADPGSGKDGYTVLANDILTDAREDFRVEDDNFLTHKMDISSARPQEYTGPKWEGRDPRVPPDQVLDDYYTDNPYSRGGSGAGSSSSGGHHGANSSSTSSHSSAPDSRPDSRPDSPELQTPGGAPPTTTAPPTTVPGGAPPTGPSVGTVPPPFVPGGPNNPTLPGKPVAPPPGAQRPPSAMPNARPTPGMTRPMSTPGMNRSMNPTATGRTTTPMTGRGMNATPKNSLLPNQRQAATGRTPVTGAGRMPTNPTGGGRSGAKPAARGNSPTGRPGGTVRKPNAGFEEQLLRNTRVGRTVPGVIGGRQAPTSESPVANSRSVAPGASRVASAGKVFGQRANKGRPESGAPKLQSGSLTGASKSKKDTSHTWQRTKPEAPTALPSGSLAVTRITGSRPSTEQELRKAALDERRARRRALWKRQESGESAPIPASELFDGTEGKVTRSVITGSKPSAPVDRSQAGKYFSTYGYGE